MPQVTESGASPIRYNGGVIYCAMRTKNWRVLTVAGDNYSEKRSKWGGPRPTKESWDAAVAYIDEARIAE